MIDAASNSVIATVNVGLTPSSICYNPQDDRVYTADGDAGTVTVIRAGTGIEERKPLPACAPSLTASVVRGTITIPQSAFRSQQSRMVLLSITGRKVAELHPGANDVSLCAPGIYFLSCDGCPRTGKVVIQH